MSDLVINRQRIELELIRRNMKQADLARLVGTSRASVSRVLAGLQESPRMVARMAQVLGIPFEDVVQVVDLHRTA